MRMRWFARGQAPVSLAALLAGLVLSTAVQAAQPVQTTSPLSPGPIPGASAMRDNVRGTVWCEVIPVMGTTPESTTEIYTSTVVDDCTVERSNQLDAAKLREQFKVPAVKFNTGRYWVFDRVTLFTAGEVRDFQGIKAQWAASMTLKDVKNILESKPYTAALITRDTEWLYLKGKPVYLLRAPDGIVWVMQVYSKAKDPSLSLDNLDQLGGKLQLPAGWKFEVKLLDKDLALQPRWASGQAHILWDSLGNAYQGCGYDKACAYLP